MKSNNTLTLHFQCKKPNAKNNIYFIAKLLIKLKINKFSTKPKRMSFQTLFQFALIISEELRVVFGKLKMAMTRVKHLRFCYLT